MRQHCGRSSNGGFCVGEIRLGQREMPVDLGGTLDGVTKLWGLGRPLSILKQPPGVTIRCGKTRSP